MVINLKTEDFETQVLGSQVPVLVDFWADWCGPCKMLAPTLDKLSEELADKAKVCKINVDEEKDLASQFEVNAIPTLLVFNNGELVDRRSGVMNIKQLKALLGIAE
ncbi:MAG: thioredoxin [Clostridiales bacterium]|jgi:thioredoxin 1|nr:thioredoxin [Clostridiales bacterium]